MKTFKTVNDYLKEFTINDIIVLSGYGIVDGLKSLESKYDTYRVVQGTTCDELVLRCYRGRKNLRLGANSYDQQLTLLSKKEFNALTN